MHYPEKKLQQPNQFLTELKGYVKTSQIESKQMQPLKLIAQLICYMDQLMCRLAQNLHTLYRQPTLQETSKGNATSQYYGSSDCDLTHLALEPKQIVIPCSNSCICKKTVLSLHWFSFQSSNIYISQEDRNVFRGCYDHETARMFFPRFLKAGRTIWEKFREKKHTNMEFPRMYAESIDRSGILKYSLQKCVERSYLDHFYASKLFHL